MSFDTDVIEKYGIDKVLTPVNLGDGEIENVILSDLRKELDFCFIDIEDLILKDIFLDYLLDYTLTLRSSKIASKKNSIKILKLRIKNIEKANPNLDLDNENDEVLLEEINDYAWKIQQEIYVLHYLKEQRVFIQHWVSEKRKQFEDEFINKITEKRKVHIPKEYYFYCEIGALFAQNHIYRSPTEDKYGFDYYYKEARFTNPSKLSKYIREEVLKTKSSVHQYIDDTLKGSKTSHNFYTSETKGNNIRQYCKDKGIEIVNDKFILNKLN